MDFPGFKLDMGALTKARAPDPNETYDLLILGGGPASMSAAIYAARKMLKLAILSRDFGGQLLETSAVENWLGYQTIDAKEMASKFEEHVKSFDIPVSLGPSILKVSKDDGVFKVATDDGKSYKGKALIYALGKRHRPMGIPGERELIGKGVAYCATCDAPFFKKKRVVVVGGGNSAFTTAIDLIKVEAQITMINFTEGWSADESLLRRVRHYDQVRLLNNHQVMEVEGKDRVGAVIVMDRKTGKKERIEADGVFVEIGLLSNSDPVKGFAALNKQGEVEVDCACHTSVKGMYAAGDVTTVPYKQIVIAAGEGAKAALAAYEHLVDEDLV
jgi:alkyl hydroperoxide reductase subunit F